MTDHRYRYRLPDGQTFESVGLARIKRQHPDAYIVGRIEFNALGEGTLVPYHGDQPEDAPAVVTVDVETLPAADARDETPARQRKQRGG